MAFTRRDSGSGSRGGKKFGGGGAKFGGGSKFGSRGGSKFGGGSRFGGGSKFGERKPRFGGDRDDRPPMFDAICGECGSDAKVPFRPNGSKPVLCSNCFKKDGGSGFSKPAYRESRPFSGGASDRGVQDQLKEISKKLDAILDALDV